jgi:hypothetical protein
VSFVYTKACVSGSMLRRWEALGEAKGRDEVD